MAVDYGEAVLNFYKHEECGTHWADLWSCGSNDECPKCKGEIEPYVSLAVSDIEAGMANIHTEPFHAKKVGSFHQHLGLKSVKE